MLFHADANARYIEDSCNTLNTEISSSSPQQCEGLTIHCTMSTVVRVQLRPTLTHLRKPPACKYLMFSNLLCVARSTVLPATVATIPIKRLRLDPRDRREIKPYALNHYKI